MKKSKQPEINVLLVYPDFPDTFWSFKHAIQFISKKATHPPLGLLTVAAMLPRYWNKKLVDMNVSTLKDKDIQWADYVFISAMAIQDNSVRKVIKRCMGKGVKIVAGGPLFTASHEAFDGIDHFVLNEAEITLPLFLEDLKKGRAQHIYTSTRFPDLVETPLPLWELVDKKKYVSMNIQYSRGCPFDCEFCDITALFGRKVRTKSKVRLLTELEKLYDTGWRGGVFFVDDNFIGGRSKLKKEILPALIRWQEERKNPYTFATEASIDLADDEKLMKMMAHAGFDSVFVGIETPEEESLAECGKLQNRNRDLVESVKKIQSFGMEVRGGFIVGFDNDSPAIFGRQIEFIRNSGIITAMVGLLNAPRNTRLYQRLKKENRLIADTSGNNTDLSINFIPKMDYSKLIDGYKAVIRGIYAYKPYYQRVRQYLTEKKPVNDRRFRLEFSHIKALFQSIFVLGIKERGRVYYWKLFFWSLFRRPKMFPMAITYSIYGFHFRKVFPAARGAV
jgi:radical SAM superfamily enzyme YgiQ (UPF0313 family)